MNKRTLTLFLFVISMSIFVAKSDHYFRLQIGYEYVYKAEAEAQFASAGMIHIKATFGLIPISKAESTVELSLNVHHIVIQDKKTGHTAPLNDFNFTRWCSFVIFPHHGEIQKVFHPADEDLRILAMKKALASLVFGKLHSHDDPALQDANHDSSTGKWKYTTIENSHEGRLNASYSAEPTDQGIRFIKTRPKHPYVKAAVSNYTKVLDYDFHLGLVRKVTVDETFETGRASNEFDPFENDRAPLPGDSHIKAELPIMQAIGSGSAILVARNEINANVSKPKSEIVEGSIHVDPNTFKHIEKKWNDPNYPAYLKGNFSCLKRQGKYGTSENVKCFTGLVNTLKSLPDEHLVAVIERIFQKDGASLQRLVGPSDDVLHLVDALSAIETDLSLQLLVEYGFSSGSVVLKRMLSLFSDIRKPTSKEFDINLERYCFKPKSFQADLQDEEAHQQAFLALGCLIDRHNTNGQVESAHRLVRKVENMLGMHDPYNYGQVRSALTEEEAMMYDMHHVILLDCLGNARMDRSFEHIVSYINASTNQLLKRSGLHALRSFNQDKAASVLYEAATTDESILVRHESALTLRRHPRAALFPHVSAQGLKQAIEGPPTREDAKHQRKKRALKDLFVSFSFHLKTPHVDWRKMVGSNYIGASFGLVIRNELDVDIDLLSGQITIDIHDEAYIILHLGFVEMNYNLFIARVCFYGTTTYNMNILQEYSFEELLNEIEQFFSNLGKIIEAVKYGVDFFHRLVNGELNIESIIEECIQALQELPDKVADLRSRARNATELIGVIDEKDLPPFLQPIKAIIHRISNLYGDVKTDVMGLYHNITDITIVFKRSYKCIYASVKAVLETFDDFHDSPKQAIAQVFKAVLSIKIAITDMIETKSKVENAFAFLKDVKPYWMDLKERWLEVKDDVETAMQSLDAGSQAWINSGGNAEDAVAKLTKGRTSVKKVKANFVTNIRSIMDDLLHPIKFVLGDLVKPFLDSFYKVVDIIEKFKKAFVRLKRGYEIARQIISVLFGPRAHALFPRTIRKPGSGNCNESGFFPSNIGYNDDGIDVLVKHGNGVVAPFAGLIVLTNNPHEVKISVTDGTFSDVDIFLSNVVHNSTIQHPDEKDFTSLEVYAGQQIGTAARVLCSTFQNHIHLVMKKTNGDIIDPTRYLERRLIQIPIWNQGCNDYKLMLFNKVVKAGRFRGAQNETITPKDNSDDVNIDMTMNSNNKPKSKTSTLNDKAKANKDNVKRLLQKLGFPKLGQYISKMLKKFDLKKLKLGKIVGFLDALNMTESTEQLAQVIRRIKELIDAKPCFNPHQLSDDELRKELVDRSLSMRGKREMLIKRILTSDSKCPLLQLKMPKQIYCVFDEHCLAVQCCVNLKVLIFNKAFRAFARIDPCDLKLVIGLNEWRYEYQLKDVFSNSERILPTHIKFDLLNMDLEIVIKYKLERIEDVALVSLTVSACSQDDSNDCITDLPLLDDVVLLIPICYPNGTFEWPDIELDDYFSVEAIKQRLKEAGKKLVKSNLINALHLIGIPKELLLGKGPCPKPEFMTLKTLKKELMDRGLLDTGSRKELNERLNEDDLTCQNQNKTLILPAISNTTVNKLLHYKILNNCTRIDVCVGLTLKSLDVTLSFRAFVDFDICSYVLKVGFEKYRHVIPVFVVPWGEPQQWKIIENIFLKYTIDRDSEKKVLIVDFGVKICYDEDCPIDVPVVIKKEIPQPICNDDFSLSHFKPGDGTIKKFLKELGGKITLSAFDYILRLLKLDKVLTNEKCKIPNAPPPACPWELTLLPSKVMKYLNCHLADNCLGLSCCLHLPFKLPFIEEPIHKYADVAFQFSPCAFTVFTKFGSIEKTKKLGTYNWGEESTFTIGDGNPAPITFRYSIAKRMKEAVINLNVTVCLPIDGDSICIPDEDGMQLLKDTGVPLCDANALAEFGKRFKDMSIKEYITSQGFSVGEKICGAGIDMFLQQTGIKAYLNDVQCDSSQHPYTPSVDGWRNECNTSLFDLPVLPDFVKCHFDESCISVQCCVDVDFYKMFTHSFHFYMTLDTCDLFFKIGFEKMTFSYTLLEYAWGKIEQFKVLNLFTIKYSIDKDDTKNVFIISLQLCVSFDKIDVCFYDPKIMDNTEISRPQCDLVAPIDSDVPDDVNTLKAYMHKLGKKASGHELVLPLRMLGLGSFIGIESLCPDRNKPVLDDCPVTNITLPTISSDINCTIQTSCDGIECCMDLDIGFMRRSFRVFVTVDQTNYELTVGFENWQWREYLFTYKWGKVERFTLGSVITLVFSIQKTNYRFKINLRLEANIGDYPPVNVTILGDYFFPISAIPEGRSAIFPFKTWDDYTKSAGGSGSQIVWEATQRFLGLDDVIDGSLCPHAKDPSINKKRCPHLNMAKLAGTVSCTFDDLCLGVTCCVEVDFKVMKKRLKMFLIVDTSKHSISAGFEKKRSVKTIVEDISGAGMSVRIAKTLHLLITITNLVDTRPEMLSLDFGLRMKLYDQIEETTVFKDLQIPQTISNEDWRPGVALDKFTFLSGTVTKNVLRRLDLSMNFFDVAHCSVLSSSTPDNACFISLPSPLSDNAVVRVDGNCLGIYACVKLKVLSLEYEFKVKITLLPREYKLRIAVERWESEVYIFDNFDTENTLFVKNAIGVTYKLSVDGKGHLLVSFGFGICIDKQCANPVRLLEKTAIRFPYTLDNGTLVWPTADTSKMKEWLYNRALETSKDLLGVDEDFFRNRTCQVPPIRTCPYFKLPTLPPSLKCMLTKSCTGIECCLDVQMKILKRTFKIWAFLDPCKFVFSFGFERWVINDTLNNIWGAQVKKDIADTITLEYIIDKTEDNRKLELSVKFSVNLDKYSIHVPSVVLFDKATIYIPICQQKTSTQPRLIWQQPREYKNQASAITLTKLGIDARFLHATGCKPYSINTKERCSHLTLPSNLPRGLSVQLMDTCMGIDACLTLDLKVIKRSLRVGMLVNPCDFSYTLELEKWSMNASLSSSHMGLDLVENIGAVFLKYKVDKTADLRDFVLTLKVGLCLDSTCNPDVVIIDNMLLPIPFCEGDGTLTWPSYTMVNISGELTRRPSTMLLNRLGVKMNTLYGTECNDMMSAASVCPYLRIPSLPNGVKCGPTQYCTGVTCCATLNLKVVKRRFQFGLMINPCEFTLSISFERDYYNMSLVGFTWGTKLTRTIGNVRMNYAIMLSQEGKEFLTDLDLQLCIDGLCSTIIILQKHPMPVPLCSGVGSNYNITWSTVQNYASVIYNILGVGVDFFKQKHCLVETSISSCPGVNLPNFSQTHCKLAQNCLGIQCCFDLDVNVSKVRMSFHFNIEHCKKELFFSLEKKDYRITLVNGIYGVRKKVSIGSMLTLEYLLYNTGYTYKSSFTLTWCQRDVLALNKTCQQIDFLDETSFKQDECLKQRKRRSLGDNTEMKSSGKRNETTSDIGDDTPSDVFSITRKLLDEGKDLNDIQQYFNDHQQTVSYVTAVEEVNSQTSYRTSLFYTGRSLQSYVSGYKTPKREFRVEGGEAIQSMLGRVRNITGRTDKVFNPGEGLTEAGIEMLGKELASMTVGDIAAMLDMQNLDPAVVQNLMKDLWKFLEAIFNDLTDTFVSGKLKEYFFGDLYVKARADFPKRYQTFFRLPFHYGFGGLFFLKLELGVRGFIGADVEIGAKVLQMWAYAITMPYAGITIYGEIGVGYVLYAKLRIEGTIIDVRFPIMADVRFRRFPLDIKVRLDVVLRPLTICLKALLTIEVDFLAVKRTYDLFKKTLWEYQAPDIGMTIFDKHSKEDDISGPVFESFAYKRVSREFEEDEPKDSSVDAKLMREQRSILENIGCQVHQLIGRDYTEPALEVSVKAFDDKSQVKLYLDMGLVPGGTDLLNGMKLGGESILLTKVLVSASGHEVYVRVRGVNSAGLEAHVDCFIPTYDITPPAVRIIADALITSNRHIIKGSYKRVDDSAVAREMVAIGLGKSHLDDQIAAWKFFSSVDEKTYGGTVEDALDAFTAPTEGRLLTKRTKLHKLVLTPKECAKHCLKEVPQKCMSFNYHYGKTGACELLEGIESVDNKLTKSDKYFYYERLGIGSTVLFIMSNLLLRHNNLYYINTETRNVLGYSNLAASHGILSDFTFPEPGLIANASMDITEFVRCEDLIPGDREELRSLCVGVDAKENNHRVIIDGPGSKTVQNGLKPMEDEEFTRINNYIAGNWDGFYDLESGIRCYSLAVGREVCEETIRNHRDPHGHLNHETEWTHQEAIEVNPPLQDGRYYLTVRALNKVNYGGPLVVSVCHSRPYVIDNTPPIIEKLWNITYNDYKCVLTASYVARDAESGIKEMYTCMGRTTRDCTIKPWTHKNNSDPVIQLKYKLPDGVRAWLKIMAINHVDLSSVGVADYPIMVDGSPPERGIVNDGNMPHEDQNFTKDAKKICANWFGFSDPQSGISLFELSVGMSPFSTDIVDRFRITPHHHSYCVDVQHKPLSHGRKYFFTVTAWNGGVNKMEVNATSDGVMLDLTAPVNGIIVDGSLEDFTDVNISSLSAVVTGHFSNSADPESGIVDVEVQVEVASSSSDQYTTAHHFESVYPKNSFYFPHLHLKQGDRVRSTLKTTNGANNTKTSVTDGFSVDLTPPKVDYIQFGDRAEREHRFLTDSSEVLVSYAFRDAQSGINFCRVHIYEIYDRTQTLVGESRQLFANQTVYTQGDLNLRDGATLFFKVECENMAVPGLTTVARSANVKIDRSPPEMSYVFVGVSFGEVEESQGDIVFQADTKGIFASWNANDGQSGINSYQVCVGTTADTCDILDWKSMGKAEDGYIDGLTLGLFSATGRYYYVSVRAKNGAGLISKPINGTRIAVVDEDSAGYLVDGDERSESGDLADVNDDIDVTLDSHSVTVQFEGYHSHLYGIQDIQWAIGSYCLGEDLQPFMSEGIILSEGDNSSKVSGKASTSIDLTPGMKYFTSVRATTYEGKILEACSDGFTVDQTPPTITITRLGLEDQKPDSLMEGNSLYQQGMLSAAWQYGEDVGNIAFAQIAVSNIPGTEDTHPLTNLGRVGEEMVGYFPDENSNLTANPSEGEAHILEVYVGNDAGLITSVSSAAVFFDSTPPVRGVITLPKHTKGVTGLTCLWSGFKDDESGIKSYEFGIGSTPGKDDILPFKCLPPHTQTYTITGSISAAMPHHQFFATVRATNFIGLKTDEISDAITVDVSPPIPGVIVETTDSFHFDYNSDDTGNNRQNMKSCATKEECELIDAACQQSMNQVAVTWTHFTDAESGIESYQLAVGTTPGGSQIRQFFDVPRTVNKYHITDLNLRGKAQVFVTIRAYNGAGLSSLAFSNGVYLSYVGQHMDPPQPLTVQDGDSIMNDMDYQRSTERISAHWNGGDPCPSTISKWGIERIDGKVIQEYTSTYGIATYIPDDEHVTYDGLHMKEGEMYFVKVKKLNYLGYPNVKRSDGVTVRRDDILPGRVYDGSIKRYDLKYLPWTDQVSANWEGFGHADSIAVLSGNAGEKDEKGAYHKHQIVQHYEVAVGTDRRFQHTRDNIVPFTNVGLNTSVSFKHLKLVKREGIYYTTVRACSTTCAQVTSNGFQAGFDDGVKNGQIVMPEFWSNKSHVLTRWENFKATLGILFYSVGLSDTLLSENYTCDVALETKNDTVNFKERLFHVAALKNIGDDTMVEYFNLNLTDNSLYYIYVIATDGAGVCNMTYHTFLCDTTPPSEGELRAGPYWHMNASYTATNDHITVYWRGCRDEQSGINQFVISLWMGTTCGAHDNLTLLGNWIRLTTNYSTYSLIDLKLKKRVPYFIKLRAYNGAGLFTEMISSPVMFDDSRPSAGDVVDGHEFTEDLVWQHSTSEVKGYFLHLATKTDNACQEDRLVDLKTCTKYDNIGLGVKQGVYWGVVYAANSVQNDVDGAVTIHMTRVKSGYSSLRSGAIALNADIARGGDYTVSIHAADGDGMAVTSVTLCDGGDDMLQEYNWERDAEWTGVHSICMCCYVTSKPVENCPCDCTEYQKVPVKSIKGQEQQRWQQQQPESDVIALKTAPTKFIRQRACGFQLFAGVIPYCVLWCSSFNNSLDLQKDKYELDFDPSKDWHTYKIKVFTQSHDNPNKPEWCIQVSESSRNIPLMVICGIEEFSAETKLVFNLWNKDNYMPKLEEWRTTARFRDVRLPASNAQICRNRRAFSGGASPVVAYEAGVGSKPMAADVIPFEVVSQPCIPCLNLCDVYTCNKSCNGTKLKHTQFTLDGLSLTPNFVEGNTSTNAILYFLTVKAVLGSGVTVMSSSNGLRIDISPPYLELNVTYIDMEQNQYKPIHYQSSNSTIKAMWSCKDNESMIKDNQWAIGTKPGLTDILNFVSVGQIPIGSKDGLERILRHNHTYYVTVICTNFAGLELLHKDDKGVKVLLEKPIVRDIITTLPGTEPFEHDIFPKTARKANNGTIIAITWPKARDKNIQRYDFGIGTSPYVNGEPWTDDIFPFIPVSRDEGGKIKIKDGFVYYNDTKTGSLCEYSRVYHEMKQKHCVFNLERGRTIFFCMKLCNLADVCTLKDAGSTTFVGNGSSVVSSSAGRGLGITITSHKPVKRDVNEVAAVTIPDGLKPGQTVVAGLLSINEVKITYGSDISARFKKYIQNPSATSMITERTLQGRIIAVDRQSFFLNSVGHVPMPGPVEITVPYLAHQRTNETMPILLHWNTETQSWRTSSKTCTSGNKSKEAFGDSMLLKTLICSTHDPTGQIDPDATKPTEFFSSETQFVLAEISRTVVNSPPIVHVLPMITVAEDSVIVREMLTATDPDGDKFVFKLDDTKPPLLGAATISPEGQLVYLSCMDCVGIDTVYYTVTEVNMGDITALQSASYIVINITDIPDAPEMFLSHNGTVIYSSNVMVNHVNVSVEQNTGYNVAYRALIQLVGAYDRDISDVLALTNHPPTNGILKLGQQNRAVPSLPTSCDNRKANSLPCFGLKLPHMEAKLSWLNLQVNYTPHLDYYGLDNFTLQVSDGRGFATHVIINVHVLQNPCNNSGTCRGLIDDFNCTDHRRSHVQFADYYTCSCTNGWSSHFCHINKDDCLGVTCDYPYTCMDKLDGYDCLCPADWQRCHTSFAVINAVVGVTVVGISFLILAVVLVYFYRNRLHGYWVRGELPSRVVNVTSDDGDEEGAGIRESIPGITNGGSYVVQNPAFKLETAGEEDTPETTSLTDEFLHYMDALNIDSASISGTEQDPKCQDSKQFKQHIKRSRVDPIPYPDMPEHDIEMLPKPLGTRVIILPDVTTDGTKDDEETV